MNENNIGNRIKATKTPIDVMLEMVKSEIEEHVLKSMNANSVHPALMAYVLKSITLDIYDLKNKQLAGCFVELQKNILESEEENQEE